MLLRLRRRIGQPEDVIRQPSPESLVVCELLEELHVVVEHGPIGCWDWIWRHGKGTTTFIKAMFRTRITRSLRNASM